MPRALLPAVETTHGPCAVDVTHGVTGDLTRAQCLCPRERVAQTADELRALFGDALEDVRAEVRRRAGWPDARAVAAAGRDEAMRARALAVEAA